MDRQQADRIQRFLADRVDGQPDPRVVGKALAGQPFWSYRVGDIRILARIEDAVFLVLVVEVGRRDHIYRR
ncbi:MAG: type II toxin-antitoxin system RelE/ParE family toxin [Pseudonocardiales bacterium]|nr:type II toxin-antitoxin system RelE/ParE family toxin [Pseudonocardiales bacterium]